MSQPVVTEIEGQGAPQAPRRREPKSLSATGQRIRDEIRGLMSNLLVSRGAPIGRKRFSDWLDEHAPDLGRTYASELTRHYR